MKIMERDERVISFLQDKVKVARTFTLTTLFYPNKNIAQRRLTKIVEAERLKRDPRKYFSDEYIYFYEKPKKENLRHDLLVTDFYYWLHNKYVANAANQAACGADKQGLQWWIEKTKKGLRPDAEFIFTDTGEDYFGTLEVEESNNGFDGQKYIDYYITEEYKKNYPYVMPTIFLVSKIRNKIKSPADFKGYYFTRYIIVKENGTVELKEIGIK